MTTQTAAEIEAQFALDLETIDYSIGDLYGHYVLHQQGATTRAEMMALAKVVALCGFIFKIFEGVGEGPGIRRSQTLCPACQRVWETKPR
jgi:hypothetical protein